MFSISTSRRNTFINITIAIILQIGTNCGAVAAVVEGEVNIRGDGGNGLGLVVVAEDWFGASEPQRKNLVIDDPTFSFDLSEGFWIVGLVGQDSLNLDWLLPSTLIEVDATTDLDPLILDVLQPSHKVTGTLKSQDGQVVSETAIVASSERDDLYYEVGAVTDDSGEFTFDIASGLWTFSVWGLSFNYEPIPDQRLEIDSDSSLQFIATPVKVEPLEIAPLRQPKIVAGKDFRAQLRVIGGGANLEWEASGLDDIRGNIDLDVFSGVISGTIDIPGTYLFTAQVSEFFGPRSGEKEITLTVLPNNDPPTVHTFAPEDGLWGLGGNSIIRVSFDKQMKPFGEDDLPWLHWYVEGESGIIELDRHKIQLRWSEDHDSLSLSFLEPLPVGHHKWMLNRSIDSTSLQEGSRSVPFQDLGGNILEAAGPWGFLVNGESGKEPLSEEKISVTLWRERYLQANPTTSGGLEWMVAQVQRPHVIEDKVARAMLVAPDDESAQLVPTRISSSRLSFQEPTQFFTDSPSSSAEKKFELSYESSETGNHVFQLDLPGNQFPPTPIIRNLEELKTTSNVASQEVLLDTSNLWDVDEIEIVINLIASPALFLNPHITDGILAYRKRFAPDVQKIPIPAGTLFPSSEALGSIRYINYVGSRVETEEASARSAFVSTREFTISVKDPKLLHPIAAASLQYRIPNSEQTDWIQAEPGDSLPALAEIFSTSKTPSELSFGRQGSLHLRPGTQIHLDATGATTDLVHIDLLEGQIESRVKDSTLSRQILISTSSAQVLATHANTKASFQPASNETTIEVIAGEVQARARTLAHISEPVAISEGETRVFNPNHAQNIILPPRLEISMKGGTEIKLSWPFLEPDWLPEWQRFRADRTSDWNSLVEPIRFRDWELESEVPIDFRWSFLFRLSKPEPESP